MNRRADSTRAHNKHRIHAGYRIDLRKRGLQREDNVGVRNIKERDAGESVGNQKCEYKAQDEKVLGAFFGGCDAAKERGEHVQRENNK